MDTVTLNIIFRDEDGKKVVLKLNDIKSDVTSAKVEELANKIIDDGILTVKGKAIVNYVNAEKVIKEIL